LPPSAGSTEYRRPLPAQFADTVDERALGMMQFCRAPTGPTLPSSTESPARNWGCAASGTPRAPSLPRPSTSTVAQVERRLCRGLLPARQWCAARSPPRALALQQCRLVRPTGPGVGRLLRQGGHHWGCPGDRRARICSARPSRAAAASSSGPPDPSAGASQPPPCHLAG
jgi:hypothetical protein